jgi:phage-related protein
MKRVYSIGFFIDEDGRKPVEGYLYNLTNEKDINILIQVIQRLSRVGQYLIDTNMAKHIDGPIYELRKDRHRILYAQTGNRFILLLAFYKATKKTPRQYINLAHQYYEEYITYNNRFYELLIP